MEINSNGCFPGSFLFEIEWFGCFLGLTVCCIEFCVGFTVQFGL